MKRPTLDKTNGSVRVAVAFDGKDAREFSTMAKDLRLDEAELTVAAIAFARASCGAESGDFFAFVDRHRDEIMDFED